MPLSEKRLLANRKNSLKARKKCTGPKDCSSTKFNAIRHGMTAIQPVMLANEDVEEYKRLCESVRSMLSSKEGGEDMLAEKIAFCFWRLGRGAIAEGEIIQSYAMLEGIDWQALLKTGYMGKICRYERKIMNYLNKLLGEFKDRCKT